MVGPHGGVAVLMTERTFILPCFLVYRSQPFPGGISAVVAMVLARTGEVFSVLSPEQNEVMVGKEHPDLLLTVVTAPMLYLYFI